MIDAAFPALNHEVDTKCEDCGGTGHDPGGLDPIYPEDCQTCNGSGVEPDLLADLTLAERIVASIAVVNYRKKLGGAA